MHPERDTVPNDRDPGRIDLAEHTAQFLHCGTHVAF